MVKTYEKNLKKKAKKLADLLEVTLLISDWTQTSSVPLTIGGKRSGFHLKHWIRLQESNLETHFRAVSLSINMAIWSCQSAGAGILFLLSPSHPHCPANFLCLAMLYLKYSPFLFSKGFASLNPRPFSLSCMSSCRRWNSVDGRETTREIFANIRQESLECSPLTDSKDAVIKCLSLWHWQQLLFSINSPLWSREGPRAGTSWCLWLMQLVAQDQ